MLAIEQLTMIYETKRGRVKAVNKVDLSLGTGEILGLVGESGCGKSATLLTILGLVPYPGKVTGGRIIFQGEDLLQKTPAELRKIRGKEIAMIFQDPMTTLNPVFKVGEQIRESLQIHGLMNEQAEGGWFKGRKRKESEVDRVYQLMREVGIPSPEKRYFEYPFQFSGGMQQRAIIAIALACSAQLLLADEPTTALDVTIQAQILELLAKINRERETAMVLVTHNLAMAAEFCQRIAVMYAGEIVEQGPTDEVLEKPKHPYTQGLLRSIPRIGKVKQKLEPIPGTVPDLASLEDGTCPFYPRCAQAQPACLEDECTLEDVGGGHWVKCALYN
ncbi:Putative ABC transporter [Acididesulfobacillus acetoxydans]|uniref:ABC transporter n=1 Tax=Acididesulfobacillus acetoxydans TaxID=1561005 RepID=A0A8S0Y0Q0_9FIRM|nr:ABC transporter ATP-binding protein [Acididesulfobacillus acetoxydans]CAA7603367.1 Putative ABC transporter [Acididesulfobacillus acetoxydans]CEJ09304.1 Dipeptide transport ATP-binding protein DppD [Acididesulfobacillus acetoxydans]